MTFTISKDFEFSAAHQLHGLVPGHQCGRVHGHNYRVRVRLESPLLNETGFVFDYGDLASFKQWLDSKLDHRDLNEALRGDVVQPSAENLARYLAIVVPKVCSIPPGVSVAVGVSETPKTWAWYSE